MVHPTVPCLNLQHDADVLECSQHPNHEDKTINSVVSDVWKRAEVQAWCVLILF